MIPRECEKCIHCRVCAYNNPKRKQHCGFYEESRQTGEWIDTGDMEEYWAEEYQCSICGAKNHWNNFCPNCGAKMKGEE